MKNSLCATLLDTKALSPSQLADLNTGCAAVEAFWAAVEADPFPGGPVLCRCILAALSVRDILHSVGREDALVFRTGLEVRRLNGGQDRSLMIGDPAAPKLENKWNAHMTVRLGDILLDPSHGQTKRDWNQSPKAAAFKFVLGEAPSVNIKPGKDVKANASHCYISNEIRHRVTYFKLPFSVEMRTRRWQDCGDAHPERRRSLVKLASSIFLERQQAGSTALAA